MCVCILVYESLIEFYHVKTQSRSSTSNVIVCSFFTTTIKASDSDSDSEPEDEDNEDYLVILTQTVNQSVSLYFAWSRCFPFPNL